MRVLLDSEGIIDEWTERGRWELGDLCLILFIRRNTADTNSIHLICISWSGCHKNIGNRDNGKSERSLGASGRRVRILNLVCVAVGNAHVPAAGQSGCPQRARQRGRGEGEGR